MAIDIGPKDMSGKKFGRLTAVEYSHSDKYGKAFWLCLCDCGNTAIVSGDKLRREKTKSCGCLQAEKRRMGIHRTHGLSETRLYSIWCNMKARCNNPKVDSFKYYGAKGITVCDSWRKFENFFKWANETGYNDGLTIERIDVNGDYKPENCKWIKPEEQSLNKTNSHHLTISGNKKTIKEWSSESGIKYDTIERRINAYGWSAESAVTVPPYRKRVVLSGY